MGPNHSSRASTAAPDRRGRSRRKTPHQRFDRLRVEMQRQHAPHVPCSAPAQHIALSYFIVRIGSSRKHSDHPSFCCGPVAHCFGGYIRPRSHLIHHGTPQRGLAGRPAARRRALLPLCNPRPCQRAVRRWDQRVPRCSLVQGAERGGAVAPSGQQLGGLRARACAPAERTTITTGGGVGGMCTCLALLGVALHAQRPQLPRLHNVHVQPPVAVPQGAHEPGDHPHPRRRRDERRRHQDCGRRLRQDQPRAKGMCWEGGGVLSKRRGACKAANTCLHSASTPARTLRRQAHHMALAVLLSQIGANVLFFVLAVLFFLIFLLWCESWPLAHSSISAALKMPS